MKNKQTDKMLKALTDRVKQVAKRLLIQDVLKVIMFCMLFVVVFVFSYSQLDHLSNFGVAGRTISLIILMGGLLYLAAVLIRNFISCLSYSQVANFIESNRNYDQQLVAAIEYHENQDNYPYSKELAERLVNNIHQECRNDDFKTVASPWKSIVYAVVITVCVFIAGLFLLNNIIFYTRYFNRLTQPTASIAPLPLTELELITGDIVIGADRQIKTAALIHGRLPENPKIVIEKQIRQDKDDEFTEFNSFRTIDIKHIDNEGQRSLEYNTFLDAGKYRYRFKAGQTATSWKDIQVCGLPDIKEIVAHVSNPQSKLQKPYKQQIDKHTVDIAPSSMVKLNVFKD